MWSRSSPALSRWNSFSSATSGASGTLSVMDILNLWNDDPEEILLDLGFGCDEPDLSGRIPARFINHQSQARGINLQVFLEAQKNRLDLENPDVSNRFRELEVLQQVTTAFSSLVGSSSSSPLRALQGKDLPPEARERRRRMGMIFRRASKKSLSQIHSQRTQDLTTPGATSPSCAAPDLLQPLPSLGDNKVHLKRVKPGLLEAVCLSPLEEEQGAGPDPQPQPHISSLIAHEGALRPWPLREGHPLTVSTLLQRKKSPGQARESFEMEEIYSFDDCSVTGGAENLVQGVIRTSSCQSDSSGFLEEPFIPSLSQQASPGPDLIKALSVLSGGSNDSQSSERPGSPSPPAHTSPSLLLSSSLTSSGVDKCLLSSPCPTPEHSLVLGPSPSPVLLCLLKSDLQNSETETPPDKDRAPPASLPAFVCEYLPPCSPELQNATPSQYPTPSSPASFTSLSPTSPPMQPASLIRGSEEIKTEGKGAPYPHLSNLSHDSEGTTCSTFSSVPPPASPPSPSPNLDCPFSASIAMSSTQSDSSSGSPGNNENSLCASGGLSSVLCSSPYSPPSAPPDIHGPSSLADYTLIESLSQSRENNQKNSLFPDSDGIGLSHPPTDTQKKEEETSSSLSFQLDRDTSSAPTSLILDSSKFEKGSPVCQSALSPQPYDPDDFIDPTVGRISYLTEQSISQQDRPYSHDNNTDPAPASPVQDVIHVKMDHLYLEDLEDTLQRNGKGEVEGERHTDTVQTREAVVYISDTESSSGLSESSRLVSKEVYNQTEKDPQVSSCSMHDRLSAENKPEELRKVCQMEMNGTESESPRSSLVLHDEVPKDLIEIGSLDMVFQTSVDGSESENGDVDAFFHQLDAEGRVYWAEPIQVSNPASVLEESGSFEASDRSPWNSLLPRGQADSFSSTGRAMPSPLSSSTMDMDQTSRNATAFSDTPSPLTRAPFPSSAATPVLKPSSRSVSVQMSSSLSSHIVLRKDVPYMTDSKRTLFPSVLPLDTSSPYRAVQSWTDLQIQRNTLTKELSHVALHTVPNEVTVSMSASETPQRPTLIFSSSPSLPLLSNDWQSHDRLPGMARNDCTVSVSMDKGLWPDEEEEVDRNGNEDEEKLWEGNQTGTMACCCSCDHQCTCCTQKSYNKQHSLGNSPYSLDELEEMMLCLQQFRSVLSNMEEQLSEEQAAVYSSLSEQDREKVRDIEELRRTVKQEAGELEMQLSELVHHYDDSLKMKMHRLLDEQSLLCSQLRGFLPGTVPTSLSPAPNRTVATQCCLLPWINPADTQNCQVSSWSTLNVDSPRQSPPGSESICEGLGCSPTKADKLDIVGFLQRVRTSHYDLLGNE